MSSSRLRKLVVFDLLAWTHCRRCRRGGLATLHVSSSSSSCWRGPAVAVIVVVVSRWHMPCVSRRTRHCRRRRVAVALAIRDSSSSSSSCWRGPVVAVVMAWPCCISLSFSSCWCRRTVVVVSRWHLPCASCRRCRRAVVDPLSLLPFKSSCCGGTYHACLHCHCLHRDCMDTLSLLYYWRGWWVVQVVVVLVAPSTRVTALSHECCGFWNATRDPHPQPARVTHTRAFH